MGNISAEGMVHSGTEWNGIVVLSYLHLAQRKLLKAVSVKALPNHALRVKASSFYPRP